MKTSDIYSVNLGCRSNNDAGYQAERRKGCVTPYPLIKDEIIRSSGNNSSNQDRLVRRQNIMQATSAACPEKPLPSLWFYSGAYSDEILQTTTEVCPEKPSPSLWFYSGAYSDEDDNRLDTESRRSPENILDLRNHITTEVVTCNQKRKRKEIKKKKRRR